MIENTSLVPFETVMAAVKNANKITHNGKLDEMTSKGITFYVDLGEKCMEIRLSVSHSAPGWMAPYHDVDVLFGDKDSMAVIFRGEWPSNYDVFGLIKYCEDHSHITADRTYQKRAFDWLTKYNTRRMGNVRGS